MLILKVAGQRSEQRGSITKQGHRNWDVQQDLVIENDGFGLRSPWQD